MRIGQLIDLIEEIKEDHGDLRIAGLTGIQVQQENDNRVLVLVHPDSE